MCDTDNVHVLNFNEIKQAAEKIEDGIIHTPLCEAKMSKCMDYEIYLKCENLQYTGSCAERGIRNLFVSRHDEVTTSGVIVPSIGNLAIGAAYHGEALGIQVTVVLPDRTPPALAQRCSELNADVVICGETLEDATNYAKKVHMETGQFLLSPDEPAVMAGLGTVGMEIITQLPEADAVIVPVGSGGLLASVLIACTKLKCSCLVYGVECAKVPKMLKACQAGHPVTVPVVPNLAEGLNTSIVGRNAFATIKGRLDRVLEVDEVHIARAMISVLERERLVTDGAGACALAAIMQGLVPELRGKRTVCILTGGNIDSSRLSRTIHRGLSAWGRLIRFAVPMGDNRSGLENLAKVISDEHAVLKSLVTEQMWVQSDVGTTWANAVVETANEEHSDNFKDRIRHLYPSARFAVIEVNDKKCANVPPKVCPNRNV
ncbi:PREDICTED: L-threonine ammonia-lyase-like [Papilio polytes]|uniref:L-threonine ammonia-lyase-like n=1 Tax=Papilio polytes TaxID=76194 RepID=UPI000676316F|nr:PREDICTED: L-threonine ammonia-lyase-like [Papilio polytes]